MILSKVIGWSGLAITIRFRLQSGPSSTADRKTESTLQTVQALETTDSEKSHSSLGSLRITAVSSWLMKWNRLTATRAAQGFSDSRVH